LFAIHKTNMSDLPTATTLSGILKTITLYRHPLLIGKINAHGTEVSIIGNVIASPARGSQIDLIGRYVTSPTYGLQFSFKSLAEKTPDASDKKGIIRFLCEKCDGIGMKKAEKLYSLYGDKTLQKLASDPAQIHKDIGLSIESCNENQILISSLLVSDTIRIPLLSWGFSPAVVDRVHEVFKDNASHIVNNEPYQLVCVKGIGFKTLDQVLTSRKLVSANSPQRGMALIYHILKEEINQKGNTVLHISQLLASIKTFDLDAPISVQAVIEGINEGIKCALLADTGDGFYSLPDVSYCENYIASALKTLAASEPVSAIAHYLDTSEWSKIEPKPNALQIEAVEQVKKNRVSIITGGPGTGKTFTLRGLIQSLPKGLNLALMAPTGKAAKRMSESLKGLRVPLPTTIHKFLRQRPDEVDSNLKSQYVTNSTQSTFEKKTVKPDLVIVDEMSMVDVHLFSHLLSYIGATPHLVLIGDVDQLPSIGPGLVLADLINSGKFSTVRLLKNERQVAGSAILTNAYNVLNGQPLTESTGKDWVVTCSDFSTDLVKPLLETVQSYVAKGYDPLRQIQVLCPQHKGSMGTQTLNSLIRNALNPASPAKPELLDKDGSSLFRLGDKVVSTKNHHLPNGDQDEDKEVYVVNGDTGTITDLKISHTASGFISKVQMIVDFDTHKAKYTEDRTKKAGGPLDMLQQAWAMSVHKSQGSEYPVVIISLTNEVFMDLLNRPLLYTAITRGKEVVEVFASQKSIINAIKNTTPSKRITQLQRLLK
jgi:exodeoxyribonuclease V alpha subunit